MAGACGATGAMADCCAHARGAQSRIAATASIVGRPILAAAAFSGGQSRLKAGCGQNCPPSNLGEGGVGRFMGAPPLARETEPGRAARLSQKDEEEHTGVDVRNRRNARAWLC